ncbi:CSN4 COP9 signalosome complex subunit 4 [Zymoseptoria tritici IPO323]|uniref:COP9 signalosome complex subunit 4 n=1 Tax=Zymoseptoria tritici (strain CBS 115943 / IPO323) TaxID=336722 RepID=F9WX45_ZYMTI|nr:CSN4 COP9 signalosome complex subunit 4 [Zymoseptoria tritici IPO323]EGP91959.1 CSN4 COP9 signalosome complex subunit 4 [Zymoseptoria tritici IPO323]
MSSVENELAALESATGQQRSTGYNDFLKRIISSEQDQQGNLVRYVQSITSDNIGVIVSRPLLSAFVEQFRALTDNTLKIEAGTQIVDLLAPKIVSFEQQDTELKFILADAHEAEDDFRASAKTLETISLESSQRAVTDDQKAKIIFSVTDQTTRLQFQLSQARISDSQRAFLDASAAYLALSNEAIIDEDERLRALSSAITCAVLAPAGPLRARQLAKLYKDERTSSTPEFSILEKIFLDRILAPSEVAAFAANLESHQLAKTSDGSTVLDKAVLEHNLLAVSRIYSNISFQNLGALLGVDADRAEVYASAMVESNRLSGAIDQIEEVIHFNTKGGNSSKMDLRAWHNLAEEVEKVATMIQREEPAWYEQHVGA